MPLSPSPEVPHSARHPHRHPSVSRAASRAFDEPWPSRTLIQEEKITTACASGATAALVRRAAIAPIKCSAAGAASIARLSDAAHVLRCGAPSAEPSARALSGIRTFCGASLLTDRRPRGWFCRRHIHRSDGRGKPSGFGGRSLHGIHQCWKGHRHAECEPRHRAKPEKDVAVGPTLTRDWPVRMHQPSPCRRQRDGAAHPRTIANGLER